MFGIGRRYSIQQHPFIVTLENIIPMTYSTGCSPYSRILYSSVDCPRQFQSMRLRPALFVFSTADSDKPDATVFVQLRSILEPPWGNGFSPKSIEG
jgi:hypothetical protein